jgi:hypothetical protein
MPDMKEQYMDDEIDHRTYQLDKSTIICNAYFKQGFKNKSKMVDHALNEIMKITKTGPLVTDREDVEFILEASIKEAIECIDLIAGCDLSIHDTIEREL